VFSLHPYPFRAQSELACASLAHQLADVRVAVPSAGVTTTSSNADARAVAVAIGPPRGKASSTTTGGAAGGGGGNFGRDNNSTSGVSAETAADNAPSNAHTRSQIMAPVPRTVMELVPLDGLTFAYMLPPMLPVSTVTAPRRLVLTEPHPPKAQNANAMLFVPSETHSRHEPPP